jgi:hypothetical protein
MLRGRVLQKDQERGGMTLPHSWLTTAREGIRSALRHLRDRADELAPEEGQQVGVELILKRGREAVRCARIVDLLRALDEPGRSRSGDACSASGVCDSIKVPFSQLVAFRYPSIDEHAHADDVRGDRRWDILWYFAHWVEVTFRSLLSPISLSKRPSLRLRHYVKETKKPTHDNTVVAGFTSCSPQPG